MTDWESLRTKSRYAEIARSIIGECQDVDFTALGHDPFGVLNGGDIVRIVLGAHLPDSCGGGGYYDPNPPTIHLHPSISRRDNFTLLHEFGHHLQQHHNEWAFMLMDMTAEVRRTSEEAVSDEIAVQTLIPWSSDDQLDSQAHPADVMAGLFKHTQASRSAVLHRAAGLLPGHAKWILAVADLEGLVASSRSTYADAPPAMGSIQQGFAALAAEAVDRPVRRRFVEGIRYSTGSELHDMRAEASLDWEGRYVFVALTPEKLFGTGTIEWPVYECANPSCGQEFQASWVRRWCMKCSEPACSWCEKCSCDPTDTGQKCPTCRMILTPYEVSQGKHECW